MSYSIIIEPHYFGSIEYYTQILNTDNIHFEIHQHYSKQTYKNRCIVLTPQGIKSLIVPVHFNNRTPLKEVRIDYSQKWKKDHLGLLAASYGKAAFYDFYFPEIETLIDKNFNFLLDLTLASVELIGSLVGKNFNFRLTDTYTSNPTDHIFDMRETILAKKSFIDRHFYKEVSYFQNFGSIFVGNLSVLDCLMNTGPECYGIIKESSIR